MRVSSGDRVTAVQYLPPAAGFQIALLNAEVGFVSSKAAAVKAPDLEIDAQDLSAHLAARFTGQVLTTGQEVTFEYQVSRGCWARGALVGAAAAGRSGSAAEPRVAKAGCCKPARLPNISSLCSSHALRPALPQRQGINYLLKVSGVMVADPSAEQLSVHRGLLMADSAYVFETRHGGGLKVTGQRSVMTTQARRGAWWGGGWTIGAGSVKGPSAAIRLTLPLPPISSLSLQTAAALQAQGVQL